MLSIIFYVKANVDIADLYECAFQFIEKQLHFCITHFYSSHKHIMKITMHAIGTMLYILT